MSRGRPGIPRPQQWKSGPDPDLHDRYVAWLRARSQARYRGEAWNMEFDDWVVVWGDQWHRRGRSRGQLQLVRVDWELPWHPDNVVLMDREEFHRMQGARRRQQNQQWRDLNHEV